MNKQQVTIISDNVLFGGKQPKIVVIPDNDEVWAYGEKEDPTQFSPDKNVIQVKSSFDMKDMNKWLIHERVHALHFSKGIEQYADDKNPYPTNTVEQAAYKTQLFHLIREGVDIEKIKTDPIYETLNKKFQRFPQIMQSYYDEAMMEWNRQIKFEDAKEL